MADGAGEVVGWGSSDIGEIAIPLGESTSIDAGLVYNGGIKSDRTLAGWGNNPRRRGLT